MKVKLFDPHDGYSGCTTRLPTVMKKAVDALAGKEMNLSEAQERLQVEAESIKMRKEIGIHLPCKPGDFMYDFQSEEERKWGFISLKIWPTDDKYPQYNWRLIKWKPIEEANDV